jgi:hypothetical protein
MFAELTRLVANITLTSVFAVERATRIELALSAWENDLGRACPGLGGFGFWL